MTRVFHHQQLWRVTPAALAEATNLLTAAILREHHAIDHVIGIANGGIAPARIIAAKLRARTRTIRARHNTSNDAYQHATGAVQVDLDPLTRSLNGHRIRGRILLVDDICGSGATLRATRHELTAVIAPSAQVLAATLCLNTGATSTPDYWVWTVSDWVVFPWEQPPAGQPTQPLPVPTEVNRHV